MNKKFLSALLLASCCLAGCNNPGNSSSGASASNTPDSTKPSASIDNNLGTPPVYDEPSVSFHYSRKDNNYTRWALWLWKYPTGAGAEYQFNGIDEYGAVASYPLSKFGADTSALGFIVKSKGSWSSKDPDGDRVVQLSEFETDSSGAYHIYLKSGDSKVYISPDGKIKENITEASFTSQNKVRITTNSPISSATLYENDEPIIVKNFDTPTKQAYLVFENEKTMSFESSYRVSVTFAESKKVMEKSVSISSLFKTQEFNDLYYYNGNDLGANYSKTETLFKVWSPISKNIKLRVYESGTPKSISSATGNDKYEEYEMERLDKGVFAYTVYGDLEGKYYTYVVTNSEFVEQEIVDPYAKSAGINGLRGMIVDFDKTNPEGWEEISPLAIDRKALTVYETHVADITSSSTWGGTAKNSKKFLGMIEEGTTYTENNVTVKTGFDHIKELGVNAVQLIPIFDQANDENVMPFNWGYNPSNYNVLEGGYSSNPHDGYARIKEFKQVVQAYNKAGMNIIMDVVYNHVNGAKGSNFDVLMPGYYYRYDASGALANGSGCGNETASEMPMMRKFMIDSVCFWAKEYKLGGFRFDLMGLHDVETMNQLTAEAKKINPSIAIYGEPWTGGTSPLANSLSAKQDNGNKYVGYGQFNDQMRDGLIKGGLNGATSVGWITNAKYKTSSTDIARITNGIIGITKSSTVTINDPNKTVNYVTCHDNYTLYDRIKAAKTTDENTIRKMAVLANSVVFTSQGTSFMLAGEEFLRTKNGNPNSYNASYKVNELNYALKVKNADVFENYRKLISFKQSIDGLHLNAGENNALNVIVNADNNMIKYELKDETNNRIYQVIHVNGYVTSELKVDLSGYSLYLDTINATKALGADTKLEPFETIIAYKNL